MEAIICCLFGVFVGMATAGYMCIRKCEKKELQITEQKEVNKDLRTENEELDLERTKLKNIILEIVKIINSIDTTANKITKIKEVITTANVK